jgi:iron complex outermembrane recepter protein
VAAINRFSSASALAALAIYLPAHAQQANDQQAENLDTVIVTGIRQSLAAGLEQKRNSTQVVESIVAEDIGKLPDNNVIEALQRVTGVQITNRGGGEADGISIRGLPDSTTTWNGRNVFTGTARGLALQDIPANLIRGIDVYKTRSSDQLETGLAGQIDVTTRRPLDFDGFEMSVNTRFIQQAERVDSPIDPNASLLVSNRWDVGGGSMGALVNVSYSRNRWRDQSITAGAMVPFANVANPPVGLGAGADACDGDPADLRNTPPDNPNWIALERIRNFDCRTHAEDQPAPLLWQAGLDRGLPSEAGSTLNINGVEYPYLLARDALFASDLEGDRKRPAANIALQWAPSDTSEYTLEAFYQGYRENIFNNLHFIFLDFAGALGPDPGSTIALYEGTNIIKERLVNFPFGFQSGDSTVQRTDTYVYALSGKWQIGDKLSLVGDLAVQGSQFDTKFLAIQTNRVYERVVFDFNNGGGIPSWHFQTGTGADAEEVMLDPAAWNMGPMFQNQGRSTGGAKTLQLDGDYELGGEGSTFEKLSFGLRYDDRNAIQRSPPTSGAFFMPMGTTLAGAATALGSQEFVHTSESFFDEGSVPRGWAVVSGDFLRENRAEVRALYGLAPEQELIRAFEVEERTSSAYVQTDMTFGDKFRAQVGVRYVRVSTPIEFTDLISRIETRAVSEVDDIMPSATLRFDVTDNFRLRANYGETLRRPDFGQLNPNFNLVEDITQVGYGQGAGGNPDLVAAKGKNYDLTAEWYFARDSAIYGTLFRREIEGLVVPLVRQLTIPGTGLNTDRFVVTQPVNASDGELEGIELGFVYFPELSGFLNGIGFQGSLTKLNSTQNIPLSNSVGEIIGEETTEFFLVSDLSYNLTLAYDRAGLGMRLSYVWRDDFLNNNEQRAFANPIGIWRRPESSLDFQLNYDFNDKLALSFDAVNLTGELQQSYYAFADSGGPEMFNFGSTMISPSYALGLRWRY